MDKKLLKPMISVIVPVHNGQDYLENCVKSILKQTYPSVQIIIVDDGSTDNTPEVCRKLCAAHKKIELITMEDLGVSAARNKGIRHAEGAYITFVDADDRIHPRMLEILQESLEETQSDFAGCDFFAWQTQSDWEKNVSVPVQTGSRQEFTAEQFVLEGILVNNTRCWSKLYRKNCFDSCLFREGLTIGEDMMLLVDMVPQMKKAVSVAFKGYGYFQNPKGAMNRKFKPSYMDQIRCWKLAGQQLGKWASENKKLTGEQRNTIIEICGARLMTGIMLTAGKLAELEPAERKHHQECVTACHGEIKECLKDGNGIVRLSRIYLAKVKIFALLPRSYLNIYGLLKKMTK